MTPSSSARSLWMARMVSLPSPSLFLQSPELIVPRGGLTLLEAGFTALMAEARSSHVPLANVGAGKRFHKKRLFGMTNGESEPHPGLARLGWA